MIVRLALWLRSVLLRRRLDREMREEMAVHIERSTERLIARGLAREAARRQATREFGNVVYLQEEARIARGTAGLDALEGDLRAGWRSLWRTPLLTTAALISLTLGIATAVTMAVAVDLFLVRPLPYPNADRLVFVRGVESGPGGGARRFSAPDYLDVTRESDGAIFAAYRFANITFTGDGPAVRITGLEVTPGLGVVLGVDAARGRLFTPDDAREGAAPTVVLSHATWQARFGGDPAVLGRTVVLDGIAHTVIGILPRRFAFEGPLVGVWTPLGVHATASRAERSLHVVGRLDRAAGLASVEAELAGRARALAEAWPATNAGFGVSILPLRDWFFDDEMRQAGWILALAGLLVLLVASVNVASLLLVRGIGRDREFAVRAALGGGRGRLVRQLLVEAALLTGLAAGAGTLLAVAGLAWFRSLIPAFAPELDRLALEPRSVFWILFATALATALAGLGPALRGARVDLTSSLREGGRSATGGVDRALPALAAGQVALTLVLLVSAGLLLVSWRGLRGTDLGFDVASVMTASVEVPPALDRREFLDRLTTEAGQLTGVTAAGLTSHIPMGGFSRARVSLPGDVRITDEPTVAVKGVTAGYFTTLRIRFVSGAGFEAFAGPGREVAVVNESLARQLWPGVDPVGRVLLLDGRATEVIGVVGDTRDRGPDNPPVPMAYRPLVATDHAEVIVMVRTAGRPEAMVPGLDAMIRQMDPERPALGMRSLDDVLRGWLVGQRIMLELVALLAVLTLLLGTVGLYGVLAHGVGRRLREFGIKLALGATSGRVIRQVLARGLALVGSGIAAGAVLATWSARVLAYFLTGVEAGDPRVLGTVALLLLVIGGAAVLIPALRAARVDPTVAMRAE